MLQIFGKGFYKWEYNDLQNKFVFTIDNLLWFTNYVSIVEKSFIEKTVIITMNSFNLFFELNLKRVKKVSLN